MRTPSSLWHQPGGYREVIVLAFPVVLTMLSQTLMWIVDTAFLGRLGTTEQGAAGLAGPFLWTLMSLCMGVGTGISLSPSIPGRRREAAVVWSPGRDDISACSPGCCWSPLASRRTCSCGSAVRVRRSAGDTHWPMLAGVRIGWGFFVPLAYVSIFYFQGGVIGGWLAAMIYVIVLGLAMGFRLVQGKWPHRSLHLEASA